MWEEASLSITGRPGLKSCRSFFLSSCPGPLKVGCTVRVIPMFQLAHVLQEGGLGDAAAAAKVLSKVHREKRGRHLGGSFIYQEAFN